MLFEEFSYGPLAQISGMTAAISLCIGWLLGGIVLIWIISYWNILYSLIISVILIFLFFILRTLQHKKIKYYLY